MNKTKLMVAAFAAIALSACSDSKKAAPQGIPDDLTFTVQKGTPLSPTEIAEITAVVKEISAANKVAMTTQYGEFLLTDTEESDSDKVERNKAYDDLTTEQKAELERAKNVCIIKDNVKQETGSEQNGSSITSSSISGADCPVQFTEKSTVSSKFDRQC